MNFIQGLFSDKTFLTIISGVTILVLGQGIQKFILQPIQDLRFWIGQISHKVKFHSNVLTNARLPKTLVTVARGDMRDLSCNLEARYLVIPFRKPLSFIGAIPKNEDIKEASQQLIFLSNAGGEEGGGVKNAEAIDKIKKSLKIEL
ncbi:MAG: hypothetical protein AAB801_02910 [Patescibacteria group bacterium]